MASNTNASLDLILNSYCCKRSNNCYLNVVLKKLIRNFCGGILLVILCAKPALPVRAQTNNEKVLKPRPEDGRIAYVTARMLEEAQYSHHPFDATISGEFLDRYLEALDPQHLFFLQSDLAAFEPYRTNLDHLTLTRRGEGDTSPADKIFARFLERLEQRVAYVENALKRDKFKFNTDEQVTIDRRDAPHPKSLDDAKLLWQARLRYEYLQEKLSLIEADKKKTADSKSKGTEKDASTSLSKTNAPAKTMDEQIIDTLTRRYNRNLRYFKDWDSDDVLEIYLTSLAHAYDPHSDYMGKSQLESFSISMNLSLFGIGAELGVDDGYCVIRKLVAGGPAEKGKKLKVGDRIVEVGQSNAPPVDIVDMSLSKAVQLIRGPKGTEVRLTIMPANSSERKVVSIIRDEIKLEDQAAKGKLIEWPRPDGKPVRLGIIDLPSFYASVNLGENHGVPEQKSTSADVALLLKKFKAEKVDGVILDLRHNGGGSLEEAVKLTGLFIKQGPVVQVRASDGDVFVDEDTDPSVTYDGPLIVLTSRFSASASEIVAGALQDYGRALIVGDISTHGKGTVQNMNSLRPFMRWHGGYFTNDPGALKLTIRKFYRPSGASTQLKGVTPDIVLPSVLNYVKDVGESSLDNPLPWDTITPAEYDPVNEVKPYLPQLRKWSDERVATNEDFVYIRQDIEKFRKQQAANAVSLNEKVRLKELNEDVARQKAREKERLARKERDEKIYEISLEQAKQPGLPAPLQFGANATNHLAGANTVMSAAGTNMVSTATQTTASALEGEDDDSDANSPPLDPAMSEVERILMDYISVLSTNQTMTATR